MKSLELSPRAERSLDEIAEYSALTFGAARGRR
jgi:plasmid stabilization system protein ParE